MAFWDGGIPEVDLRGWIARAVSNRAPHMSRGRGRRLRHELECGLRPWTCLPEQPWLAREKCDRLAEALDALPAEWRTGLLPPEVGELDDAEIARTVGSRWERGGHACTAGAAPCGRFSVNRGNPAASSGT